MLLKEVSKFVSEALEIYLWCFFLSLLSTKGAHSAMRRLQIQTVEYVVTSLMVLPKNIWMLKIFRLIDIFSCYSTTSLLLATYCVVIQELLLELFFNLRKILNCFFSANHSTPRLSRVKTLTTL